MIALGNPGGGEYDGQPTSTSWSSAPASPGCRRPSGWPHRARVLVISAGDGSTPWAQGGIATAFGDDDPADHARDTRVAGAGFCDDGHGAPARRGRPAALVADLIASARRSTARRRHALAAPSRAATAARASCTPAATPRSPRSHRVLAGAVRAAGVEIATARVTGLLHDRRRPGRRRDRRWRWRADRDPGPRGRARHRWHRQRLPSQHQPGCGPR